MNLAPHHQAELARAGLMAVPIPRGPRGGLGQVPPSNATWHGSTSPAWAKNWGQVAPAAHFQPMDPSGSILTLSYIAGILTQNASTTQVFYFLLPNGMLFRVHPGGTQLDVCLDMMMGIPVGPGMVGVYRPADLGVSFVAGMVPIAFKPNCAGPWKTVTSSSAPGVNELLYQQMQNYSGVTQGYAAYFTYLGDFYRYVPGTPPAGGGFTNDTIQKCAVPRPSVPPPAPIGLVVPRSSGASLAPIAPILPVPQPQPIDDTTLVIAGIAGVLVLGAVLISL